MRLLIIVSQGFCIAFAYLNTTMTFNAKRIFISLALLVHGLQSQAQSNLYFLNQTGRDVWVQKRTILEQGSYPYTLEAGKTEYQTVPLQINEPAILNLVAIPLKDPYGTADGIYYLLKPNDSLIVTLGSNNKPVLSHVSNPKRTQELGFIQKHLAYVGKTLPYTLFGFSGNTTLSRQLWSNNLKKRDRLLDSLYRPYITSAESFCITQKIDPAIGRFYKNYYWGSLINDKLFVDREIDKTLRISVNTFYRDSLINWSKQATSEDCNNIPAYKNALHKIYSLRFGHLVEEQYLDAIAENAVGINRDFLLSRYLLDRMELTTNSKKLLAQYDGLCKNEIYKNLIHNIYTFHEQQSKITTDELATLIRPDKSELGFTTLLQQLKGNVIYIDFWASWCRPCIAEFPASHALKEKIKNQNITMLYLSVDTDFDSWIKAREKHKINDKHSFILSNPQKNELVKKINLGPIPRYIIIDQQGQILRMDAQRPSDPEILNTLLTILNKP